jgi:hypothetical protein
VALCAAVREMADGLYEADLGGGLLKKRIAQAGQGKSGGFRTLVATNKGSRWIFVYGFPKNARSNIDKDEEEALKTLAAHLLSLTATLVPLLLRPARSGRDRHLALRRARRARQVRPAALRCVGRRVQQHVR